MPLPVLPLAYHLKEKRKTQSVLVNHCIKYYCSNPTIETMIINKISLFKQVVIFATQAAGTAPAERTGCQHHAFFQGKLSCLLPQVCISPPFNMCKI